MIRRGEAEGIDGNRYYGYETDLYEMVRRNMLRHHLVPEEANVHMIRGLFEVALYPPASVALAHLDGDWYESTRTCLERIEPRLVPEGRLEPSSTTTTHGRAHVVPLTSISPISVIVMNLFKCLVCTLSNAKGICAHSSGDKIEGVGSAMKYASLRYPSASNLGDEIQSLATEQHLPRVDVRLDRDSLCLFKASEPHILVMQGWFSHSPQTCFPPSSSIVPVFIGFHLENYDHE